MIFQETERHLSLLESGDSLLNEFHIYGPFTVDEINSPFAGLDPCNIVGAEMTLYLYDGRGIFTIEYSDLSVGTVSIDTVLYCLPFGGGEFIYGILVDGTKYLLSVKVPAIDQDLPSNKSRFYLSLGDYNDFSVILNSVLINNPER